MPPPRRLLMTSPAYFDVQYVINPHMEGQIGRVDRAEAVQTWTALHQMFSELDFPPDVVEAVVGLPDMVFCANQTLPYLLPDGQKGVILSHMHADQRKAEVPYFQQFFVQQGYQTTPLPETHQTDLEGMGDALWHPNRRLIWGGYGFRTDLRVYEWIAEFTQTPVIALALHDPEFYHLDTCMCLLDEETVLIYPPAFQPEGLDLIRALFPHVLEAPEAEARHLFAVNAFCPDQKHVVIQQGCTSTRNQLETRGFAVIEAETREFIKAGGSVFCMKLAYW